MDKFIWNFDNTEAIRGSDIKSFIIHDSEGAGSFRWLVYAENYDGELTCLVFLDSEQQAKEFVEAIISVLESLSD